MSVQMFQRWVMIGMTYVMFAWKPKIRQTKYGDKNQGKNQWVTEGRQRCELTWKKSSWKVTSAHVGLQGIMTGDEAQAAWPGPTAAVADSWAFWLLSSRIQIHYWFLQGTDKQKDSGVFQCYVCVGQWKCAVFFSSCQIWQRKDICSALPIF